MDDFEADLAKILKQLVKDFRGGFQPASFSFSYGYSTSPNGTPSNEKSGPSEGLKRYQFKDFNIRYYFDPKLPETCYLNMTNVPEKDFIKKVYIDNNDKKNTSIKVYIDCTNYFIVDYIDVGYPCTLESYSMEKSSNSKILILKLKF